MFGNIKVRCLFIDCSTDSTKYIAHTNCVEHKWIKNKLNTNSPMKNRWHDSIDMRQNDSNWNVIDITCTWQCLVYRTGWFQI